MRSPEKIAVGVITTLGTAVLVYQGVMGEQQRQQVQPNLPGIWTEAGALDKSGALPVEKLAPGFTKQVQEHLEAHNAQFKAEGKQWSLLITEPVRIKITEPEGVFVRSLPDQRLGQIRKALEYNSDQKVHDKFVVMNDEKTNEVSIWVVRPSSQGPEFFAIYHKIEGKYQELVELTTENSINPGQPILVIDLLQRFFPELSQETPTSKG